MSLESSKPVRFCCCSSSSPDGVRVGVVASDGGDDPARLLALSDGHLVVTLRQNRTLVHVVNVDGDRRGGGGSVPAAHQSHRILSAEHEDVLALALKVQDLGKIYIKELYIHLKCMQALQEQHFLMKRTLLSICSIFIHISSRNQIMVTVKSAN